MSRISYEFTVTLDADEELSDANKDALAAMLASAVPGAKRITCARTGPTDTSDQVGQAHPRDAISAPKATPGRTGGAPRGTPVPTALPGVFASINRQIERRLSPVRRNAPLLNI
jgi:hypothetical protein